MAAGLSSPPSLHEQRIRHNAEAAAKELEVEYQVEKVTEITEIMKFGVMVTPALVIDGQVKVTGKVADVGAIKEMLS